MPWSLVRRLALPHPVQVGRGLTRTQISAHPPHPWRRVGVVGTDDLGRVPVDETPVLSQHVGTGGHAHPLATVAAVTGRVEHAFWVRPPCQFPVLAGFPGQMDGGVRLIAAGLGSLLGRFGCELPGLGGLLAGACSTPGEQGKNQGAACDGDVGGVEDGHHHEA